MDTLGLREQLILLETFNDIVLLGSQKLFFIVIHTQVTVYQGHMYIQSYRTV